MISLGNLHLIVKLRWNAGYNELLERLKVISLLVWIENKKSVSIDGVVDHILRWQATKLHYLKQLIVIKLARKDWGLNE